MIHTLTNSVQYLAYLTEIVFILFSQVPNDKYIVLAQQR